MRIWPAVLAVTVALSGCIGGHATGIPREADDNATVDAAGVDGTDGTDGAPPWAIKKGDGTGAKDSGKDPGSKTGTGGTGGGATGSDGSGSQTDPGTEPAGTDEDDPGLLGDGSSGASGADGVTDTIDDTVPVTDDLEDPLPGTDDVLGGTDSTVEKTLDGVTSVLPA